MKREGGSKLRNYQRHNVTMREAADQWGISRQGVDQLERHALRKLWQMGLPKNMHLRERALRIFIKRQYDEQQTGFHT